MKTATVRELRNHYTGLLRWVAAGEEVLITQKGEPVARLIPVVLQSMDEVDWADSPEVKRDRREESQLTAEQVDSLIHEAGGKW
ncbi:MAG: type II toxin-antitoxin system prevent-host-death family antitoxin [Verrucomicrobiales bacterium]|nr:type II toxin-antitoxin system prevent-host-death family antitoxin [Verrucomicrobiales bacterium]